MKRRIKVERTGLEPVMVPAVMTRVEHVCFGNGGSYSPKGGTLVAIPLNGRDAACCPECGTSWQKRKV